MLSEEQRTTVARITDALDQACAGPPDVREFSRDRVVLGEVLGDYLHRVIVEPQSATARYWPILEMLRAAGADEEQAAARANALRAT